MKCLKCLTILLFSGAALYIVVVLVNSKYHSLHSVVRLETCSDRDDSLPQATVVLVAKGSLKKAVGSECYAAADTEGSLSIHMVVVPFLHYDASKEAILEREKDYKLALQKNLAHPLVQCVHLLTTNFTATDSLDRFKDTPNNRKMKWRA